MIDPRTGQQVMNISCRGCRQRHPAEWSCGFAAGIAQRERALNEFIKSFFKRHEDPEIERLITWIEEDTTRAAVFLREIKDENMGLLVALNEYDWKAS